MTTNDKAVVAAAFGTASVPALKSIANVMERMRAALPGVRVAPAFSSRFVLRTWQKRRNDPEWLAANTGTPEEILKVRGPLATIADLQEEGFRDIAVQSLHVHAGEEYETLRSVVRALSDIRPVKARHRPFDRLVLGRPALGEPGEDHPYTKDMEAAAAALAEDAETARQQGEALLYMGHGNRHFPSGIYAEFEHVLRRAYPDQPIIIGVMEGFPGLDRARTELAACGLKKVMLVPLLLTAGRHVVNDMTGEGPSSWQSVLESDGLEVECVFRGLGEMDAWADLYVERVREAFSIGDDR
jgi:sirohydrochlorin cobaltochelatase